MQVVSDIKGLGELPGPVHLAIGMFDGVHRGHAWVIGQAVERARKDGGSSALLTFDPHPLQVLRPGSEPQLLTSIEHKVRIVGTMGVDAMCIVEFNKSRAMQAGVAFIDELDAGARDLGSIAVGKGFRFGHGREGDFDLLETLGKERGFAVHGADPVRDDGGEIISSTRIRALLRAGELEAAAALLGRLPSLFGTVIEGRRLGREIGFPTANVRTLEPLPPLGVYAVRVDTAGESGLPGVANLGRRPTIEADAAAAPLLEVHLLDFEGELYGEQLEVHFVKALRPEQKFDGVETLRRQIAADVVAARSVLS